MGRARSPIHTVKIESERNWITAAEVIPITRAAQRHWCRQRSIAHTKIRMQSATIGSLKSSVVDCKAIVRNPKVTAAKTDIHLPHRISRPMAKTMTPATAVMSGLTREISNSS